MSDIVERLRTSTAAYASYGHKMLHEAADEIERLRKQAVADVAVVNSFLAQRDQAEAEVERLRRGLDDLYNERHLFAKQRLDDIKRITWLQEQIEELQKETT